MVTELLFIDKVSMYIYYLTKQTNHIAYIGGQIFN